MTPAGAAQARSIRSVITLTKILKMIKTSQEIVDRLRLEGHRITPVREKILEILTQNTSPISATDLINNFKSLKFGVNKTTIYRELEFLFSKKLLIEVEFGEGNKRYELNNGHHHHLVCLNCKKVEDVDLKTDLSTEEKLIEKNTGFKIESHSLEFFGYCKNCRKSFNS